MTGGSPESQRSRGRSTRVVVLHPEAWIAAMLVRALAHDGYEATAAMSVASAITICRVFGAVELAVVDGVLLGADATRIGARLRRFGVRRLLALLDTHNVSSRRLALGAGADDYIVRPFSTIELSARARVLVACAHGRTAITLGDVLIDLATRAISVAGEHPALTRKERELVLALARAGGATVSRRRLLVEVWETDWHGGAQTITVHVSTLRRKLARPDVIRTGQGGYRLAPSSPS